MHQHARDWYHIGHLFRVQVRRLPTSFSNFNMTGFLTPRARIHIYYSLVKRAHDQKKPVIMLNIGPTRADELDRAEKYEWKSGDVLREACEAISCVKSFLFASHLENDFSMHSPYHISTSRGEQDVVGRRLLKSGTVKPLLA